MFVLLGFLIGLIGMMILREHLNRIDRNYDELMPRWLSKDKPYERHRGGYIIYANGSRFYLDTFGGYKLWWLYSDLKTPEDIDRYMERNLPEFCATWLPKEKCYSMIKRIINTHPNLGTSNTYWKLVKLFS